MIGYNMIYENLGAWSQEGIGRMYDRIVYGRISYDI